MAAMCHLCPVFFPLVADVSSSSQTDGVAGDTSELHYCYSEVDIASIGDAGFTLTPPDLGTVEELTQATSVSSVNNNAECDGFVESIADSGDICLPFDGGLSAGDRPDPGHVIGRHDGDTGNHRYTADPCLATAWDGYSDNVSGGLNGDSFANQRSSHGRCDSVSSAGDHLSPVCQLVSNIDPIGVMEIELASFCGDQLDVVCDDRIDVVCDNQLDVVCDDQLDVVCDDQLDVVCDDQLYVVCDDQLDVVCDDQIDVVCEDQLDVVCDDQLDVVCDDLLDVVCDDQLDVVYDDQLDVVCDDQLYVVCDDQLDVVCDDQIDVVCDDQLDVVCDDQLDVVCDDLLDVICDGQLDVVCGDQLDVVCDDQLDVVCDDQLDVVCDDQLDVVWDDQLDVVWDDQLDVVWDDQLDVVCYDQLDVVCYDQLDVVCDDQLDVVCSDQLDMVCDDQLDVVCDDLLDVICDDQLDVVCGDQLDVVCDDQLDVVCDDQLDVVCSDQLDVVCDDLLDVICDDQLDVVCGDQLDVVCDDQLDVVCNDQLDVVCDDQLDVICDDQLDVICDDQLDVVWDDQLDVVCSDQLDVVCGDQLNVVCGDLLDVVCGDQLDVVCDDQLDVVCDDQQDVVCGDQLDVVCGDQLDVVCDDQLDVVCSDQLDVVFDDQLDVICDDQLDVVCGDQLDVVCDDQLDVVCDDQLDVVCSDQLDVVCSDQLDVDCGDQLDVVCDDQLDVVCDDQLDVVCDDQLDVVCDDQLDVVCSDQLDVVCDDQLDVVCGDQLDVVCGDQLDVVCSDQLDVVCDDQLDVVCDDQQDVVCDDQLDVVCDDQLDVVCDALADASLGCRDFSNPVPLGSRAIPLVSEDDVASGRVYADVHHTAESDHLCDGAYEGLSDSCCPTTQSVYDMVIDKLTDVFSSPEWVDCSASDSANHSSLFVQNSDIDDVSLDRFDSLQAMVHDNLLGNCHSQPIEISDCSGQENLSGSVCLESTENCFSSASMGQNDIAGASPPCVCLTSADVNSFDNDYSVAAETSDVSRTYSTFSESCESFFTSAQLDVSDGIVGNGTDHGDYFPDERPSDGVTGETATIRVISVQSDLSCEVISESVSSDCSSEICCSFGQPNSSISVHRLQSAQAGSEGHTGWGVGPEAESSCSRLEEMSLEGVCRPLRLAEVSSDSSVDETVINATLSGVGCGGFHADPHPPAHVSETDGVSVRLTDDDCSAVNGDQRNNASTGMAVSSPGQSDLPGVYGCGGHSVLDDAYPGRASPDDDVCGVVVDPCRSSEDVCPSDSNCGEMSDTQLVDDDMQGVTAQLDTLIADEIRNVEEAESEESRDALCRLIDEYGSSICLEEDGE